MRAIRCKNTKPEMILRKALHAKGFRYRLHVKTLLGCPDIVLPKYKAIIFVHGCFWHGHRCPLSKVPKTRTQFWLSKISQNIVRDNIAHTKLIENNWRIAIVWECALKGRFRPPINILINELTEWLTSGQNLTIELQGIWIAGISND